MIKEKTSVQAPGLFFIRVLMGIVFFMQGYGKVFTIGLQKVYDMFFKVFETSFLPHRLILYTAYYTSYAEMICGFLLMIGLFRKLAMYLLGIDLLVVSFGHGLMEPIWDLSHVMPRAILLAALLLLPSKWDKWSIDALIKKLIALSV